MPTITLTINHEAGLHLRPATLFVQTAGKFASDITITHGERSANAKSMLTIVTLGVEQGSEVTISAEGDDAQQALDALKELVESNFGE